MVDGVGPGGRQEFRDRGPQCPGEEEGVPELRANLSASGSRPAGKASKRWGCGEIWRGKKVHSRSLAVWYPFISVWHMLGTYLDMSGLY